jgi:hypothetical protein
MAMANRDCFPVRNAHHFVGVEPLGNAPYWLPTHGFFHLANAFGVEKSDQPTMTVILGLTKPLKQIRNQWWNPTLLCTLLGMNAAHGLSFASKVFKFIEQAGLLI